MKTKKKVCELRYKTQGIPICSAGGGLCDKRCYEKKAGNIMDNSRQQEIGETIANAKNRLNLLLKTLPGYDDICECDKPEIADTFHEYGDENEICLNCGGIIGMC